MNNILEFVANYTGVTSAGVVNRLLQALIVVSLDMACAGAYAQTASGGEVTIDLKSQKIVRLADGKEGRESAALAKPGDVVEYTATYINRGKAVAKNLVATLPIPLDTEYANGSAQPGFAQAATADGVYQAMPLRRKFKLANGKEDEREVPLAEYRVLRWQVGDLAPGKEYVATARVRLSTAPLAVPVAAPVIAPDASAKK